MLRLAPWKVASILAVTLLALLLLVPSFLGAATVERLQKALPSFLPIRPIVLGLDLQGGASLLWEVDSAALTRAQVTALRDDVLRVRLWKGDAVPEDASWAVLPQARTSKIGRAHV